MHVRSYELLSAINLVADEAQAEHGKARLEKVVADDVGNLWLVLIYWTDGENGQHINRKEIAIQVA